MPIWGLRIAYWLHMAATIVWIGGLFFQAAVLAPVLARTASPESQARLLDEVRRRFDPFAWFGLAVLIATGLAQMSANPNYQGFLAIDNTWSATILSKHLVIGLMILIASYQTWIVYPRLGRSLILQASGADQGPDLARLRARQARSTRLNLALGIVVLALTAIARTA